MSVYIRAGQQTNKEKEDKEMNTTLVLNEMERVALLSALSIAIDDYTFDNDDDNAERASILWSKLAMTEKVGK